MALEANGFIPVPPTIAFQADFQPVIAQVSEKLISRLGKRLHSLYLYGSVAQGTAHYGISDLDVCIVLSEPINASTRHQLSDMALDIALGEPAVSKIDFDIGDIAEILALENKNSWGYWLKHHCRCIYGDDLAQRFALFRPSRAIAIAVNGDFPVVLHHYIDQLTQVTERNEQKKIQRAAARKLIRSTNLLRSDREKEWPETLDEYASRLIIRYPQKKSQIDYFLGESIHPSDEAACFIHHLRLFMAWLESICLLEGITISKT